MSKVKAVLSGEMEEFKWTVLKIKLDKKCPKTGIDYTFQMWIDIPNKNELCKYIDAGHTYMHFVARHLPPIHFMHQIDNKYKIGLNYTYQTPYTHGVEYARGLCLEVIRTLIDNRYAILSLPNSDKKYAKIAKKKVTSPKATDTDNELDSEDTYLD